MKKLKLFVLYLLHLAYAFRGMNSIEKSGYDYLSEIVESDIHRHFKSI